MLGFHQHAEANVISFSAAISACEKGQQWEQALQLLETMLWLGVEANIITFNAVLSALEKAALWRLALDFLEVPTGSRGFLTPGIHDMMT